MWFRPSFRVVGRHIKDGDAIAVSIRNYKAAPIRRDAVDAWLFAGAGNRDLAAAIKVEDTDGVGAGVGNVCPMASGVDGDKRRQAVDRDGGRNAIILSIDYRNCAGLRIDDVDLIADRVYCQVSRIVPTCRVRS